MICGLFGVVLPRNYPAEIPVGFAFKALAAAHRRRRLTKQVLAILSAMRGRAALAWTDTRRANDQLRLARAGCLR